MNIVHTTINYKFSKISIGAIIKNPEMQKFVPQESVVKLSYKMIERQMSVRDCYVNWKMCNKSV